MEDIINNMKERKKEKLDKNDINLSLGEKPKREHKRRQLAPKNGLGILDDELKDENEFKKELDNDLIQRPQKERKKKSREGLKKKNESSLNTNSSSEDLAPKPKVTERVLSNKDDDIMIIPDIEEEEKNEMLTTIAAPPQIKINRIPTMREFENEFVNSEDRLNEACLGIDLSFLSNNSLCYPDQIMEEDRHWDWDLLFVEIASEIQNDIERDHGYLNKLDFTPGHGLIKGVGSSLDFDRFKVSKSDS